jgi:hypothetical protein
MHYDYILLRIDRAYAEASDRNGHTYLPGDMSGPHWPKEPVGREPPLGRLEASMKKPSANDNEVPTFHDRPFLCPHCNKITAVETSMKYIFLKRVSCKHCGKQFLIRNDKPVNLRV